MRSLMVVCAGLIVLFAMPEARAATTITVTSEMNDGPSSLRQAILDANADLSPDPVTIKFAIGTGPVTIIPTSALPPITRPVIIDGTTQPGFAGTPLIELDGEDVPAGGSGLVLQGHSGSTIRGLVINRFMNDGDNGGDGVLIAVASNGHLIAGNYIGTDQSGTQTRPNAKAGVYVQGGSVTIGGTTPADRNVISGNGSWGVVIENGANSIVSGNYIGVDAAGTAALANFAVGVFAVFHSQHVTIGGAAPGAGNVIAGSANQILLATSGHDVRGNFIGTNAAGTASIGGGQRGVYITDTTDSCTIGDNLFGASSEGAVVLDNNSTSIKIQGNRIGVDATGTTALPSPGYGILVKTGFFGSPTDVTIGGTNEGEGNLIANCVLGGVSLRRGPFLGGVSTSPTGIAIRGNSIFTNDGLGIDLDDDGLTSNDSGDTDEGSNHLQNFPVLTSAVLGAADLAITGSLTSLPNATYTIDFYASTTGGMGEGQTYLGSMDLPIDASGTATIGLSLPVVVLAGTSITATATDANGNTSEFSASIAAGAATTSTTTTSAATTSTTTSSTTVTTSPTTSSTPSTTTTAPTTTITASTVPTTTTATSTTATTVTASTTTSTTLPLCHTTGIPQILCLLDGLPPSSCSGDVLPKAVTKGLVAGRNMLVKAQTAAAKPARRLEKATSARFHAIGAPLAKAAKKHKVSATCATSLGASLDQLRGLVTGLLVP